MKNFFNILHFITVITNKIKDSKSDVYINVDSNIPTYKHYVKMAKGVIVLFFN